MFEPHWPLMRKESNLDKVVKAGMKQEKDLAKKLPKVKDTKEKFLAANAQLHDGISN